ncbi:MAG: hypothetical protein N4A35_01135 [Flavobacteriales bacterium]|jgi:hypothetical protein|nr:hypothetical protein [Flavobacteriales bacterium]
MVIQCGFISPNFFFRSKTILVVYLQMAMFLVLGFVFYQLQLLSDNLIVLSTLLGVFLSFFFPIITNSSISFEADKLKIKTEKGNVKIDYSTIRKIEFIAIKEFSLGVNPGLKITYSFNDAIEVYFPRTIWSSSKVKLLKVISFLILQEECVDKVNVNRIKNLLEEI